MNKSETVSQLFREPSTIRLQLWFFGCSKRRFLDHQEIIHKDDHWKWQNRSPKSGLTLCHFCTLTSHFYRLSNSILLWRSTRASESNLKGSLVCCGWKSAYRILHHHWTVAFNAMNSLSKQVAQALLLGLTGWLRWLYRENPNIKPVENNMRLLPRQTDIICKLRRPI